MAVTREQAEEFFRKYNKSESLYHHALSVEAVMREAAARYGEDQDFWGIVGFLHDIDWEMFPEEHCRKAPQLLNEIGADDDFIHAVCSHGWGLVTDVEPQKEMEKKGVVVHLSSSVTKIAGGKVVFQKDGKEESAAYDKVLNCEGRRPASQIEG